jgi:pilus assembly protein Flp/PilA
MTLHGPFGSPIASESILRLWRGRKIVEGEQVNTILLKLYVRLQELSSREDGQDMVEYALIVCLISLGCTATSKFLATGLTTAYSNISSTLGTYTT